MKHTISRRSFVINATSLVLSQLLFGCGNNRERLQILLLEDSIPLQLISDFRQKIDRKKQINFQPKSQLFAILDLLQNWQKAPESNKKMNIFAKIFNKSSKSINLATLGDSWLQPAIQQKLIQPLSVDELKNWSKLPVSWQELVRRNSQGKLAADGKIWGAPYGWGSTVIAYRSDKFKSLDWTPTDWGDLWHPDLRDRISLLDSPREVIGLTLKKLGYSYNTENLATITDLESELLALQKQVKLYSSTTYLQPLILGDTWLAVGWSNDILPIVERYSNIKFIIPRSGTSLWSDVWVQPQSVVANTETEETKEISELISQWIDFCWQSRAAEQISLFTNNSSPIWLGKEPTELPKNLQNNSFLSSQVLFSDKSEFLLPLEAQTQEQYQALWLKMRHFI
ncbi:MAG: extracellular solute-binding protein [Pleurocapsa sp.]